IGNADATIRVSGHVIPGISNAVKAVALKHEISRRSQKGRGDASRSKGNDRFLLGSDDKGRDILVWCEAVFWQEHLHQQIIGTAPRRNADDLSFQLLNRLDLGPGNQLELRL